MLGDPEARAFGERFGRGELGGGTGGGIAVVVGAVAGGFEAAGEGVGGDDCWLVGVWGVSRTLREWVCSLGLS